MPGVVGTEDIRGKPTKVSVPMEHIGNNRKKYRQVHKKEIRAYQRGMVAGNKQGIQLELRMMGGGLMGYLKEGGWERPQQR